MSSAQLLAYRAVAAAASLLPEGAACQLGKAAGRLIGALPDYDGRRAVVASHMSRAVGRPLSRHEARLLVGEVFANYGRYWAESLRLPILSAREVADGVVTVGKEHLDAALAGGRGVIVAAPHLGGWEWGAIYLVRSGIPVTVAVEPLEPPEVFEWFASFRRRLGMNVVPVGPRAAASVLRALAANHVVCLLSDRLVGQAAGVKVDLFGCKLMLPAGPVTLSLRSGAPLLAAAIYYGEKAGSHTLVFRRPLDLGTLPGRFREQVRMGTQVLARELEELVRQAPTQWHLVQPNWPDDPPLRSLHRHARPGRGEPGAGRAPERD